MEQAIVRSLFSADEKTQYFVKFNVDGLLRGDYQSRMNGYAIGRQNGWMSANDIRKLENLDRIPAEEGGDLYLINGNMIKLKDAGAWMGMEILRSGSIRPVEKKQKQETLQTQIDGKQVSFKASSAIRRIYCMKFQRDIYKELKVLEKSISEGSEESSNLDMFSLEMFENIAFVMAKHADASIPNTPEEWLDGFNTFSIYQVLPQLIELWGLNVKTDVEAKKTSSDRP